MVETEDLPPSSDPLTTTITATSSVQPTTTHASSLSTFTKNQPDPYLITPTDNPSTVYCATLLSGDNYATWERDITKALNAKGKLCFINGTLPAPKDEPEYSCWKRADDLVSSWLLNSVTKDIRTSCLYEDSSFAIWKNLQLRFSQSNGPKLFQLRSAISSFKQETLSVMNYYTQLKSLWDQLDSITPSVPCICGASKIFLERHENTRTMEFLQGLNDRFNHVRSQLLLHEPMPPFLKIVNLIAQEESQQFITTFTMPQVDSAALQFNRQDSNRSRTTNGDRYSNNDRQSKKKR